MALPPPLSMGTNGPRTLAGLVQYAVSVNISATALVPVAYAIDGDQVIDRVSFIPDADLAASGTNYWTIQLKNAGTAGTGDAEMMAAVDTRASSLDGLSELDAEDFTLTASSVNNGEVAFFDCEKSASPNNLSGLFVITLKRAVTY